MEKHISFRKNLLELLVAALILNAAIEILNRKSLVAGVVHLCTAPHIFIINTFIVFCVISLALIFKRRNFAKGFLALIWVVIGVLNFILRCFRKTPLMATDFRLLEDAFKIGPVYLGNIGFVMVILGVIVLIVSIPFIGYRAAKIDMQPKDYYRNGIAIIILWAVLFVVLAVGNATKLLPRHYSNIALTSEQYGYVYCFTNSFFNQGIDKPDSYAPEKVKELILEKDNHLPLIKKEKNDYPNIIFLQLESFMNPNLIKNVTYSMNPVPFFEKMVVDMPSGYLKVPAFGAGTANTEFEIMTGMNLDDFGPGEYPYKTVLRDKTCESIAYVLKKYGYVSHVIHNNDGTFYGRNQVLPNLGIDTFTSLEYMDGYECNPIGWAKDDVLVEEICKTLDSTEEKDYIYAISVQGHGDYPDAIEDMELPIKVDGFREEEQNAFTYYVNQIHEMDAFLEHLTEELSKREEKTILVFYGDHLPGFSFENEQLYNGDIYETQYVVWSNYNFWMSKKIVETYQISSRILEAIGISDGIINSFHQKHELDEDYLEKLTLLEYDLLYGDGVAYEKEGKYEPTDMRMGVREIVVANAYNYDGHMCVEGGEFNKSSAVCINGKTYDTVCVNEHTLLVEDKQLENGDVVVVVQRGKDKVALSETKEWKYTQEGGK